jgi:hypothetical protein
MDPEPGNSVKFLVNKGAIGKSRIDYWSNRHMKKGKTEIAEGVIESKLSNCRHVIRVEKPASVVKAFGDHITVYEDAILGHTALKTQMK